MVLDENLPSDLIPALSGHEARTVRQMGWLGKENGDLLALADAEFEVFVTGDRNLRHQQNLTRLRRLAILVLVVGDNRVETVATLAPQILDALCSIQPRTVGVIASPSSGRS